MAKSTKSSKSSKSPKSPKPSKAPATRRVWRSSGGITGASLDTITIPKLRDMVMAGRGCTAAEADSIIARTACNRLAALLRYAKS